MKMGRSSRGFGLGSYVRLCLSPWEGRSVQRAVVLAVLRMFFDEIHHIVSSDAPLVALYVVCQRGTPHLQRSNFEGMRVLKDTCEIMFAPAVSLQSQGVFFEEKCVDSSNTVGEYEFIHHTRFVYEGSIKSPELEIPQVALITGVILISPRCFL
jgi:hypothetical protein